MIAVLAILGLGVAAACAVEPQAATGPSVKLPLPTSAPKELPPETTPVVKLPVPSSAQQAKALKEIKATFDADIAKARKPEEKAELAKSMLQVATESTDPATRFVMLQTTRDLAAQGGEGEIFFQAVNELNDSFATDPLPLVLTGATVLVTNVNKTQDLTALIQHFDDFTDMATDADNYGAASQLATLAVAVARKIDDPDALKKANANVTEVATMQAAYRAAGKSFATLAETPRDPGANLLVGKYYCLAKGQWDKGLPMLARGDDAALKALAATEIAKPKTNDQMIELGDEWWDFAEKNFPAAKLQARLHAAEWYRKALPQATGLTKTRIEKRLRELDIVQVARTVTRTFYFNNEKLIKKDWNLAGTWQIEKGALRLRDWGSALTSLKQYAGNCRVAMDCNGSVSVSAWNESFDCDWSDKAMLLERKGMEVALSSMRKYSTPRLLKMKEDDKDRVTPLIIRSHSWELVIRRIIITGTPIDPK